MGLFDETATLTAGQDPGDTSTSGLGGLISRSNLYNKAVAEGTINPNNVSLQDFDSFVVTNPELVDPSIDVSGLRTTTDANILGNIPDYEGIQYEAYNPNRLSDLMRLYSSGLPTLATDTAQIPGAIDTLVDVGGGGGQTLPGFDVDSPKNTPTDGLTQSGTFGGQPTFTTTPGTTVDDVTGDITNPDGSYGGNIVDEVALTGGTTVDDVTGDITNPDGSYGGNIVDEFQDPTQNLNNIDLGNPFNDPRVVSEEFGLVGTPSYIDPIMDPNLMDIRQQQNQEATTLGSQINSAFENVKDQGVGAIESFKDTLVELGGKVKEGFDNVIEFGDTQIDVGRTLATGAINYIGKSIFGPVGAVLGTALGALGIEGGRSDLSDRLGEKYGMDDIGRLTGGPMAGYSVDSAFGDIRQATVDRINKRKENNLDTQELEQFLSEIDYLGGDPVGANTELDIATGNITGDASVAEDAEAGGRQGALDARDDLAGVTTGDASVAEAEAAKDRNEAFADIQNQIGQTRDQDTGPTSTDPADDFDDGTMTGGAAPSTNKTGIDS
jgi:hypothetical protein